MLGFDRRTARYTWTVAVTVLVLCLVYLVRKTLFVFILALLFAYLLSPLVNLLDRVLPTNRTRPLALGLAYVIFVGAMALAATQIGSRVVSQANAFAERFPQMLSKWETASAAAPNTPFNSLKAQAIDKVRNGLAARSGDILATLSKAGLKLLSVAGDLVYIVVIPILAFFFLKDARALREHILDMVEDGPQRALLDDLMEDVHLLLAHYMRALVLLSLATFAAYSISFSILGISYAVMLAALAGILEFIPLLGPLTAAIIILIVSLISGASAITVLIFILSYRLFQDYVLSPQLMKRGVALHPLLVLFGVFAGAEIAGIPGTFLSVPVMALMRVVYVRFRKARIAAQLAPDGELIRS